MAIIKCKMCGGDLEVVAGAGIGECEYCGTKQTLPKANEEAIQSLFNRANILRLKCDFDKAEQIYEKILQADAAEAEAHWGIVLCKYGIEYVEDPKTFKRIPTCHRTSYDAVTADPDYLAALQNADSTQRNLYEAEAAAIDAIQKNILSIVKNESPFDVFICYKETDEAGNRTVDSTIANDIYHQLSLEGLKVFYAPITLEDKLGREYEPYIFAALNSAKVMLVIGTKPQYFTAVWVRNEWGRFLQLMKSDRSKLLIPCYRDMDAYELPEEFAHLQAHNMAKIGFVSDLVRGIRKVAAKQEPAVQVQTPAPAGTQLILENNTLYEGAVFAGIPHGYGTAQYTNGNLYEGNWNRGKRHGQGKLTLSDGSVWVGEFRDDNYWDGNGIVDIHHNGKTLRYEGEYRRGNRNGYGKIYYSDGGTYEGQWENGKRSGQGKIVLQDGSIWAGEFQNDDYWNGNGVLVISFVDGVARYEGEYQNGECNGYGSMSYQDGSTYEGQWKDGNRHGQGKMTLRDGGVWVGEFCDDDYWNGKGAIDIAFSDETTARYEGEMQNGNFNGYGVLYYSNGSIYEGQWEDDDRHGQGKMTLRDGGVWVGEFRNDKYWDGTGTLEIASPDGKNLRYEGEWHNGNCNGHGKMYYDNGSIYEGQWKGGECHGQGTITWRTNETWSGTFKNGSPWNGKGIWYNSGMRQSGRFVLGIFLRF